MKATTPSRLLLLLLLSGFLLAGTQACKNKEKVVEDQEQELPSEEQQAKDRLMALLTNEEGLSVAARREELEKIKNEGYTDPEVLKLIARLEDALTKEEAAAKEAEKARKMEEEKAGMKTTLTTAFNEIAQAPNRLAAEAEIDKVLARFESDDTPVLRIIYQSGEVTDYDEPTTIAKYLNYLKDMGKNPNRIKNIKYNADGKIKELELEKK